MDAKIALTRLNRQTILEEFDEIKIETFITGRAPQIDVQEEITPPEIEGDSEEGEPEEENPNDEEVIEPEVSEENELVEISIDAKRFEYSPEVITVQEGDLVKLTINNQDTTHGINIPDLGVSGRNTVEFTADEKGEFTFYCDNYCGSGHSGMSGKIIVE